MPGFSLLTPIPLRHLEGALEILTEKEFILFGSGAYEVFRKTDVGTKVFIYVSHDTAELVVSYTGTYGGLIESPLEMRKMEKQGYRPPTTTGEKWPFYWKISDIIELPTPMQLNDIKLASGDYAKSYPRGPVHVVS